MVRRSKAAGCNPNSSASLVCCLSSCQRSFPAVIAGFVVGRVSSEKSLGQCQPPAIDGLRGFLLDLLHDALELLFFRVLQIGEKQAELDRSALDNKTEALPAMPRRWVLSRVVKALDGASSCDSVLFLFIVLLAENVVENRDHREGDNARSRVDRDCD